MNTPVHATLALALLGKKDKPENNKWILWGALMPDLAMFGLFFYEVAIGTPQMVIWNEKYFSPLWENTTDLFNSIPIYVLMLLIAINRKWIALQVFCLGALVHVAGDLPLHHDDGHRHFFPFSEWRFESPVSYWDPNHYGGIWSVIEIGIFVVTAYYAYHVLKNNWSKRLLIGVVILTTLMPFFWMLTISDHDHSRDNTHATITS